MSGKMDCGRTLEVKGGLRRWYLMAVRVGSERETRLDPIRQVPKVIVIVFVIAF